MATLKQEVEWIPCSEQEPPKSNYRNRKYFLVTNGEFIREMYLDEEDGLFRDRDCHIYIATLTHWMPKPLLPSEMNQ